MIITWGFPIVVSVYLLVRIEAKLESLESAITDKWNNKRERLKGRVRDNFTCIS
ncbi:MAG: YvrJ family protein [bacterium]|nr:YvrJ family protein [bacterium]